jgi:hypothetical protein
MALRTPDGVTVTHADDGMVILDERNGRYWQLNTSAATVLGRLLAGQTAAEIGEHVARTSPVSPEQAGKDIDEFVGRLRSAGLVVG